MQATNYRLPEPPPMPEPPRFGRGSTAPGATIAERFTAQGRCCRCGSRQHLQRVVITARPNGGPGGFATFTTPHVVCREHAGWVTIDEVARPGEQELVRETAATERWWRPADVVLGVGAAPLT